MRESERLAGLIREQYVAGRMSAKAGHQVALDLRRRRHSPFHRIEHVGFEHREERVLMLGAREVGVDDGDIVRALSRHWTLVPSL